MQTDARSLGRELLRSEVADRIFSIFDARGFDAVTVDEAAREVGISRATFFRYFGSKEEVVVAALQHAGDPLPELVRREPIAHGASVWSLVRAALEPMAAHADGHAEALASRIAMIVSHPALHAHLLRARVAREEALAAALASRLSDATAAPAVAAMTLAIVDLTWRQWSTDSSTGFGAVLDANFAVVSAAPGLALREPPLPTRAAGA